MGKVSKIIADTSDKKILPSWHNWNSLRLAFTRRSKKMACRLDYQMKFLLITALLGCFTISFVCSANIHTMREIRAMGQTEKFTPAKALKMSLKQLTDIDI